MITEKEILKALSGIIDPDFKKDIVTLGFVKNIDIKDKKVSFDIELTTPACPVKDEFKKSAENIVKGLDGIEEVIVNMTSSKKSHALKIENSGLKGVKSIIAISSCKGGVGKSTIAAYLAKEIARRGFKVGLLDADLFGPSIPILFNLRNSKAQLTPDNKFNPLIKDNLKIMSFGFLMGDSPAIMRGPMVSGYIQQILHNVDWGELDYLLVDFPPGTGDVQLTITQSVQLDGAVIITTKQSLSVADVARGILMFEKVNVPMLGIIENMSYFICDNCEKKHFIFGGRDNSHLTERFGLGTLAQLPVSTELASDLVKPTENKIIKTAADNMIMALGKSSMSLEKKPQITFDQEKITLKWPNGEETVVGNFNLRLSCKCARCVDEMSGSQILKKEDILPDIKAEEIQPLGNYAISVKWNDGHSSGIFPYKRIMEMASGGKQK
tara:strand:- start:852 stop:2168 length:1317 start_codon:yes stop_codon:yes gene_type:complete